MNNLSPTPAQHLHSVLVGGARLSQQRLVSDWQEEDVQRLLLAARHKYGYALCCCRPARQLKLQIRTRGERTHLAVWPEEGLLHDVECVFFRDDLQGGGHAGEPAAVPHVPTSELPSYVHEAPPRKQLRVLRSREARVPSEPHLSLQVSLNKLWEAASLCRWHPSWTRNWGRVRWELLRAAQGFEISGVPAEQNIYVPRVYRPELQDQIDREWSALVRSMAVPGAVTSRLLIAQVKALEAPSGNLPARVRLRQVRSPVGLHPNCYEYLQRECRKVLSNSRLAPGRETDPLRPELVGIFAVDVSSRGGVWAKAAWLMAVHPQTYVPASNAVIVRLVDSLVAGGYHFEHLLSDLQSSQRWSSDWLVRYVRDPLGVPVPRAAIEVLDRGSSPDFLAARAAIAARMSERGIPTWTWVPGGRGSDLTVPPLPPTENMDPAAVRERLQQLERSECADYRYGPQEKLFTSERKRA